MRQTHIIHIAGDRSWNPSMSTTLCSKTFPVIIFSNSSKNSRV